VSDSVISGEIQATETVELRFRLNGQSKEVAVPAALSLLELLRDRCGLRGTKLACSRAVCGSCTVVIDGRPAASCALFAFQVDGADVVTIEGLSRTDGTLHLLQEAFRRFSAFQCGYCTPGMILLAKSLLDHDPAPSRATVVGWMSSNICRCTGYGLIVEAVLSAAADMRRSGP
jgi:aerobic carbon-monoxide dehydrogenase small subunit